MNVLAFTYTKDNGEVSNRVFVPLVSPTDKYFGVDISELDYEDQVFITKELYDLEQEKYKQVRELMAKYDINHSFRTFIPSKMSSISTELVD